MFGLDVGAWIGFQLQFINDCFLRTEKAHGEENQLSRNGPAGVFLFDRNKLTLFIFAPFDVDDFEACKISFAVINKAFGHDQVFAGIFAETVSCLFLTIIHFVNLGILRPWIIGGPFLRRFGHDFQLDHFFTAVAQGGADTVCSRIATADDNDFFVMGMDLRKASIKRFVQQMTGVTGEEVHSIMHPFQLASRDG